MVISNYTVRELEYLRKMCNFVRDEEVLFELRASGHTLDECCEIMHREISSVKLISRKVKRKIDTVMSYDKGKERPF